MKHFRILFGPKGNQEARGTYKEPHVVLVAANGEPLSSSEIFASGMDGAEANIEAQKRAVLAELIHDGNVRNYLPENMTIGEFVKLIS